MDLGDAPLHIAVVVPARNEETLLGDCLDALEASRVLMPAGTTCGITVVSDASTDRTATLARGRLTHPYDAVVEVDLSCVGAARRIGTGVALARSPQPMRRTWLASTDADTFVPRDWLHGHWMAARTGLAGIAGVVRLHPDAFADPSITSRFAAAYDLRDDGTHRHVHGANLGVRADAYLEVGGWSPIPVGEDHDLWNRLADSHPVRSSTALWVSTSARRTARAPHGFSADLVALEGSVA